MKALMIPPVPDLDRFGHGDMHLVLAHLMKESNGYTRHYRRQADKGAHIILDNSAFELGESAKTMDELIDMAGWVHATEIVIPDAMQDGPRTCELTQDAINAMVGRGSFFKRELTPLYVPQGATKAEWQVCFKNIVWMHQDAFGEHVVPGFCVSRIYDEVFDGGRKELCKRIADLAFHTFNQIVPIHLLGWGEPMENLHLIAREFGWVRSVDSSAPYRYARANRVISIDPDPGRLDDYFDVRLSTAEAHFAKKNEAIFEAAANGRWPRQ